MVNRWVWYEKIKTMKPINYMIIKQAVSVFWISASKKVTYQSVPLDLLKRIITNKIHVGNYKYWKPVWHHYHLRKNHKLAEVQKGLHARRQFLHLNKNYLPNRHFNTFQSYKEIIWECIWTALSTDRQQWKWSTVYQIWLLLLEKL